MKLAHLVIAHQNPQMLERLIKRLSHPDADIFIQLDKKTDIVGFKYIEDQGLAIFITNRVSITPGCYSFVQAVINGFREILRNGENYSHINLLSSYDYPLKPISEIHGFLSDNPDKTFMHCPRIPYQPEDSAHRLNRYSLGDMEMPFRSTLEKLANAILPKRKIPYLFRPYGGSPWFTITPLCAQYAINILMQKPGLGHFFKYSDGAACMFFQTILMNSGLRKNIVNDNLRYIEVDSAGNEVILNRADAGKIIRSEKLFARKFDAESGSSILPYLDEVICERKNKFGTAY